MRFRWIQTLRKAGIPAAAGMSMMLLPAWIGGLPAWSLGGFAVVGALAGWGLTRLNVSRDRAKFESDSEVLGLLSAVLPGIWYECRIYADGSRTFLRVSDSIQEILGISPEMLRREPLQLVEWLHPEDRARIEEGIAEHSRTLEPWAVEYRIIRPNGQIGWVKSRARLSREPDGAALWRGVIMDITPSKDAAATIQKSEERLALATRAGGVAIWDYEMATKQISWNDVAYQLHGVDPATYEANLANNSRFLHPDDRERVEAAFDRALTTGARDYEVECRIIRPDGQIRHTQSAAVILRHPNGVAYRVIGTEIDVTAQKQMEQALIRARDQAELATRVKNEFLGMMSHEIRTPLNGVLGFASLLKDSPLTPEQMDYLGTIESSAESLLLLVGDILDLSRIEANQLKISPVYFDLRCCLQEVSALLRPRAELKGLAWDVVISPEAPNLIHLDRLRFIQILSNLIGNAIKFTDTGKIQLRVTVGPGFPHSSVREWEFAVSDTGPGISPAAQECLFTPQFQAIPAEHRSPGGTGLGLAISRRLAELLGGEITIESSPQTGSTFRFLVAAETRAEPESVALPVNPPPKLSAGLRGKRILVVEDHPINLRLCEIHLRRLGYQSDSAGTGLLAIAKWQTGGFDAILMDMQLPELDGCGATREIRRREAVGQRIPILAMTANAMPEDRRRCLDAGMDDYLAKPIRLDLLATTLARWLDPAVKP